MSFNSTLSLRIKMTLGLDIFLIISCIGFAIPGGNPQQTGKYTNDLLSAGERILATFPKGSDYYFIKKEILLYIANTERGKMYFLNGLQMWHEILNEVHIQKLLEWLKENDINADELLSFNVPLDTLKAAMAGSSSRREEKDDTAIPLLQLEDLIDFEALFSTCVDLLSTNAAAKRIYEILSNPSLILGVARIIQDSKYEPFLYDVWTVFNNDDGESAFVLRLGAGAEKIFNLRGDRRKMFPAHRFIEGAREIMYCQFCGEEYNCGRICAMLDRLEEKLLTQGKNEL